METENEIKIAGILVELSETIEGEGKRGPWRSRIMTIEFSARGRMYSNQMRICVWDMMVDYLTVKDELEVYLSCELRKGTVNPSVWYNSITAWKIKNITKNLMLFPKQIKQISL